MDDEVFLQHLDLRCKTLADQLGRRELDKARRREARRLLAAIYMVRGEPGTPLKEHELAELREVVPPLDDFVPPIKIEPPAFIPRTVVTAEAMYPFRIRPVTFNGQFESMIVRYTSSADRLTEIAEWFWHRCDGDVEKKGPKTVVEMAMEEFGSSDMSYVWGTKKRPSH